MTAEAERLAAEVEHQKGVMATLQQVIKNSPTTGLEDNV